MKSHAQLEIQKKFTQLVSTFLFIFFCIQTASAQEMTLVDELGGSWNAQEVDSYQSWAYYINQEGIAIIDIAIPGFPQFLSFYDTPGTGAGLKVSYPYLFVAAGDAGFLILDITNPADPVQLGSLPTASFAHSVIASLNYAFVAMGDSGVAIVNIVNPSAPSLVGTYDSPGTALDLAMYGYNLYVADSNEGLRIISILDPGAPTEIGYYDTPGSASSVDLSGNYALVADGSQGLRIIDVSNPALPIEVAAPPTTGEDNDIAVFSFGNFASVINRSVGLRIVELTSLTWSTTGALVLPGEGLAVSAAPSPLPYLYIASGTRGLRIVDSDSVSEVGYYDNPGRAMDIAISGNYAFVADSYDGVMAINISSPSSVYPVTVFDTPGLVYDVTVQGNYLYVADSDQGLKILDGSNPSSGLTLLGALDTPGDANSVAISENTLYVADGEAGLRIVNVSNPASPTELGYYNTPGDAREVALQDDYAYVADGDRGLIVIDISRPSSPRELGALSSDDFSYAVAVSGSYAYLADCGAGLRTIDIRNPAHMSEVGNYNTSACARDISISGGYAYVADSGGGLLELDISNPTRITLVSRRNVASFASANGVAVANGYSYLGVEGQGLLVLATQAPGNDRDEDGVSDDQETVDNTDPDDAGSNVPVLETTLCSEWNGYLNMWNVMEHVNMSSGRLRVASRIYSITGEPGQTQNFSINAGAQVDLLVHDMEQHIDNSYGKVCSTVSGANPGDLDGRMVYYKAVADGNGGYNYDFAFAMPFLNGLKGSQFVPYNTYQPSLDAADAANVVANWIQVTNLSNSRQKGNLIFFDMNGTAIQTTPATLNAGARLDYSGHDIVGIQKVGIIEWRPEDLSAPFQLRNVRYYYRADGTSFDGAFQLEGSKGNGQLLAVPLDALVGSAILEISNVLPRPIEVDINIYDRTGVAVRHERRTLNGYQSYHLVTDADLALQGSGLATVKGSVTDSLIVTAMHYARTPSLGINSIYGLQARQALGSVLQGSYNTFLNQGCYLRVANPTSSEVDVAFTMTRYDGTDVNGQTGTRLVAHGVADIDICNLDRANVYGVVRVEPSPPDSIVATVLRIGQNDQYRFPTPVRQ